MRFSCRSGPNSLYTSILYGGYLTRLDIHHLQSCQVINHANHPSCSHSSYQLSNHPSCHSSIITVVLPVLCTAICPVCCVLLVCPVCCGLSCMLLSVLWAVGCVLCPASPSCVLCAVDCVLSCVLYAVCYTSYPSVV